MANFASQLTNKDYHIEGCDSDIELDLELFTSVTR